MDGDLDGINDGPAEDETELLDPGEMNTDDFHMRESEIQTETLELRYKAKEDDFAKLKLLGQGGYGQVFLVKKKHAPNEGKVFAMKVLRKAKIVSSEKDTAHTKSERNILGKINHPFIVNLHYAFQTSGKLFLVLEYVQGGEIFMMLENKGLLPESEVKLYLGQITLALGHLHEVGIIFRDLKPENILIGADGHVKLIDFGLCKERGSNDEKTFTYCGTIEYMAPEVITKQGHDHSADWWSLGTLMYDMLTGSPPFCADSRRETTRMVLHGRISLPHHLSAEAKDLLKNLLKRNSVSRLGAGPDDSKEVQRHSWFRDIDWVKLFNKELPMPYIPEIASIEDVSNFDPTFTERPIHAESPSFTPLNMKQDPFTGFTFTEELPESFYREKGLEFISERERRRRLQQLS